MTLDRKDYKSAIPQLEKKLDKVEQEGAKGLASFDVLKASIDKEILARKQALLKTYDRIELAMESANGKSTVYHSASKPTGGDYKGGDTWFDASHGYAIYTWDENISDWVKEELGADAIANLSITNAKIANATIQSAKIAGLDVGKLTGGYIDSGHINTGAITVGSLQDGANYSTTTQMNSAIATAKADAEKTATNYLTTISGTTGISVHSANDTSNFANVNSSGMTVYKGGTKVATFGDTATIGKTNSTNTVIDSSGLSIKNGSTNLAKFNAGNISIGSSIAGTEISTAGAIGIYPSGGTKGLRMSKINGVTTVTYDDVYFSSQPHVKARSTNANISLSSSTITKVPMTYIDDEKENGDFMSVNNGNVKFHYFDSISVEATACAYVQPSSNAFVYIFLYRYDSQNNTTTEVGAGCNYISSTYGGVVQLTPRIITEPIYANDYLYISVRCIGTTGTAYCNHKDTFLTVKFL